MNSKIIFAFCAGAVVGFAASLKYNEVKFRKLAQEEIDDVKARLEQYRPQPKVEPVEEDNGESPISEEQSEYEEIVSKYNPDVTEKKGGGIMTDRPYVIPPDEFGDLEGYETFNLTYYDDGVLAYDIDDESIDDIDDVVGYDAFNHFGEHDGPPDTVYIRNDARKCDYEISMSARAYADVIDGVLDNPRDND